MVNPREQIFVLKGQRSQRPYIKHLTRYRDIKANPTISVNIHTHTHTHTYTQRQRIQNNMLETHSKVSATQN